LPELPEVETTVRDLRKKLVGLKFKDVWTDWPKTFKVAGLPAEVLAKASFKKAIKNKKILDVRRRAKFIVIDIDGKYSIFIHQKISGHLLYGRWAKQNQKFPRPPSAAGIPAKGLGTKIKNQNDKSKFKIQNSKQIWVSVMPGPLRDDPENRFIRTIFFLSNGYQLAFSDLRRFGKIVLVKDNDLSELPEIKKLGPEPLEMSFKEFRSLFSNKRGRIKQVLMDPSFIAGIGNIYSDEILWDAGIHPLSRAENLSTADLKKIYGSIQKILKKAVKLGGTSIEDYRKISGEMGKYQNYTEAYHQHGKKCSKKDGGVIQRIKIGGRSAHFCPKHQMLR